MMITNGVGDNDQMRRKKDRKVLVAEVDHAPDGSASTVHVAGKSKEFFYGETESIRHFWYKMEVWAKEQGATHIRDPETKTYKIRSGPKG